MADLKRVTVTSGVPTAGDGDTATVGALLAGNGVTVAVTRTNDTNAYLAGDVIGAATGSTAALQFAAMGESGKRIAIVGAEMLIEAAAIISGETSYTLHLYKVTPPGALGDNAVWALSSGDRASYLGPVDLGSPGAGSTLYVRQNGLYQPLKPLTNADIYGYLVTNGAYTPTASRVYNVTLHSIAI